MSAPTAAPPSVFRTILQSLRGEHHDYTSAPLNRAVLLLAVPMVLEMVMESLFAIVDVFWVSRLGKEAVAVVGLTESVMTLVYAVAIGLAIAASAVIARRTGEKDPAGASRAAGQTLLLGVAVWGLHLGFTQGLLAAMVADTAPTELRGTAFGVFNLLSGLALLVASAGLWPADSAVGAITAPAGSLP